MSREALKGAFHQEDQSNHDPPHCAPLLLPEAPEADQSQLSVLSIRLWPVRLWLRPHAPSAGPGWAEAQTVLVPGSGLRAAAPRLLLPDAPQTAASGSKTKPVQSGLRIKADSSHMTSDLTCHRKWAYHMTGTILLG